MAQRQRARLITARSQDQNLLPVFIIRSFQNCHAVFTATIHRGGAAGARGAHNSEVVGSNPTSGIYHSLALQKLVVKMDVKRIKSGVNLLSLV